MNTQSMKSGIVWGGMLIVIGVVALLDTFIDLGPWIWVAILTIGGLLVLGVYATDRSEKWLLIPCYILFAVAGLIIVVTLDVLVDAFIATYVLYAIAIPFLVGFLLNRENWGLLIPAYVLFAVGTMVPLIELNVLYDILVAAYVMFAIAIPFFVVYIRNNENWWALIPGGILAVIGLAFLIAEAAVELIFAIGLILAGLLIVIRQFRKSEEPEQKIESEAP